MYSEEKENAIANEFPTLRDTCYLDHAGATLYAKRQINAIFKELNETIFGNPHSLNLSSRYSSDVIDQVRYRVLKHFHTNTDEYSVIFTSGATAALKLLGESFKWKTDFPEICQKQNETFESEDYEHVENDPSLKSYKFHPEKCSCESKASLVEPQAMQQGKSGTFVYLQDNHTSVLGIRKLAASNGACVHCMPHNFAFDVLGKVDVKFPAASEISNTNSLFIYPAQCNFSGVKYPLSWISKVHKGLLTCKNPKCCHNTNWFCCLDAASYVSSSDLDLSVVKPDFVCISFYKMFGYPTGLGALLVNNKSAHTLERNYFGGGTVQISLSSGKFFVLRPSLCERFEDGTLPFLSIIALRHGFDSLQCLTGGMKSVSLHTFYLSQYVHHCLLKMHHRNGNPAVVLYCDTDYEDSATQGNIVNFNLLRSSGEYVGFSEVLQLANLHGIHLRTGCFCNPGSCQRHLNLSNTDLRSHYQAGHVCGDQIDLIDGKPTGSIRISFGYMSTIKDADKLIDMIISCFIDKPVIMNLPTWWPEFRSKYKEKFCTTVHQNGISDNGCLEGKNNNCSDTLKLVNDQVCKVKSNVQQEEHSTKSNYALENELSTSRVRHSLNYLDKETDEINKIRDKECYKLSKIYIYPVKSCGPMSVKSWDISYRGLKYDREWMIVNHSGVTLTQKQETKLCLIMPKIDLENQCLTLQYEGLSSISIPLKSDSQNEREASLCESKVCGDHVQAWDCGDEVAKWLSDALHREGLRLLQQGNTKPRSSKPRMSNKQLDMPDAQISLVNQSQFLLVNTASILWLGQKLEDCNLSTENLLYRFRCNFVVEGKKAFEENNWVKLQIGSTEFQVEGPCTRCQMVCIDQKTGEKTREPLKSLAAALHGKIRFGIYLRQIGKGNKTVKLDDCLKISSENM